jgi:uncharacterized protein (TIGR02118 family)
MTHMIVVSVLYPKTAESTFDYDYYSATHVPLVRARWEPLGLERADFFGGTSTLDGSAAPYEVTAMLHFSNEDALQKALATHGAEVVGDIPNFTNVQPLIQTNRVLDI